MQIESKEDCVDSRLLFAETLEQMLRNNPGIDQRCCQLHRQYDWLRAALKTVASSQSASNLANWAVTGKQQILPTAVSTQGIPLMWNTPETCQMINRWLSCVRGADVAACNMDELRDQHPYKIMQAADDDSIRKSLLQNFSSLKSFYELTVLHGNGVIVDRD